MTTTALALPLAAAIDLDQFARHTAAALGPGWTTAPERRPAGCGVTIAGPAGQRFVLLADRGEPDPRVAAVGLYPAGPYAPTPRARSAVSVRNDQGPAALAAAIRVELPRYEDRVRHCYAADAARADEHTAREATARQLRGILPGAQFTGSTPHAVTVGWTTATGPGTGTAAVTGDDGASVRLSISNALLPREVAAAVLALLATAQH